MTEENQSNVVDLSSLAGKNGFRRDKEPTKREVLAAATEELQRLGERVGLLEGVLEMTLKRLGSVQQASEQGSQNLAMLCDSLTIRMVALTRHLTEKKILDEKEFMATTVSVSAEMLEAKQAELDARMGLQNVDRPAKEGDVVLIDYAGKIDDVPFEGGTSVRQLVKIGAGGFVDGFDTKLVGVKAGDAPTIEITFPDDYQAKQLSGKTARFDIFCRNVKEAISQPTPEEAK